jgi:hypothetical protein
MLSSVRRFSTTLRYTHLPEMPVPEVVAPVVTTATANAQQLLNIKKKSRIEEFKTHHSDTGSSQVQSNTLIDILIIF